MGRPWDGDPGPGRCCGRGAEGHLALRAFRTLNGAYPAGLILQGQCERRVSACLFRCRSGLARKGASYPLLRGQSNGFQHHNHPPRPCGSGRPLRLSIPSATRVAPGNGGCTRCDRCTPLDPPGCYRPSTSHPPRERRWSAVTKTTHGCYIQGLRCARHANPPHSDPSDAHTPSGRPRTS